jgi:nitronate monooxygenase
MITKIKRLFKDILSCLKNNKKSMKKVARPIIQGGMGVGVSGWRLAKASAKAGAIGTVSGTAVANLLAVALQKGDEGKHFHRALKHFPFQEIVKIVLDEYYVKDGIAKGEKLKEIPMWSFTPPRKLVALTICAIYAFVWLAKEGHNNPIFVNCLEDIQIPHIFTLLGAMLANVDGIVMGAGIPRHIPKVIDDIMAGNEVSYPVSVINHPQKVEYIRFKPVEFFGEKLPKMIRPLFLPIVSSPVLAEFLNRKCAGKIDGFVVEASTAGGHNAPPRGVLKLDSEGEPIYGKDDIIKPEEFVKIGLPFWLAGSFASPESFEKALSQGATGIQVGTIFAFCEDSGIVSLLKTTALALIYRGEASVHTSAVASPTGFPIKVFCLYGTMYDKKIYNARKRNCSLGYLRKPVWQDGEIIFRCRAEPVAEYVRKGGKATDTEGCMCICAGLCATVGAREGETPFVTAGDDLDPVWACINRGRRKRSPFYSYSARDAISYIRGK